jgi:hypothetical protein
MWVRALKKLWPPLGHVARPRKWWGFLSGIEPAIGVLPSFSGQYPVLGSWLIDHTPVRIIDPRGRESDHRNTPQVFAARDPCESLLSASPKQRPSTPAA